MKSISSSIVVLGGTYGITSSQSMLLNGESFLPVIGLTAGIVTTALGLVGWWASLKFDR